MFEKCKLTKKNAFTVKDGFIYQRMVIISDWLKPLTMLSQNQKAVQMTLGTLCHVAICVMG